MVILSWVKPKHVPHLSVTSPILINIRLYKIWLPCSIPQELKIQFISCWPCPILCTHLQQFHFFLEYDAMLKVIQEM